MEKYDKPSGGVTKISNPKTLQRWIDYGWYENIINNGYTFNPYCGRFSIDVCICSKCRSKRENKDELIKILCKEKT